MSKKEKKEPEEKVVEQPRIDNKSRIPAFGIPASDPFVDGVARFYANNGGRRTDTNARPFVLAADDPAALATLKNYLVRCAGAGSVQNERTERIKKAIEVFEKFGV